MAELIGKIIEINQEEVISDSLTKRTFVIEDETKYKNQVCFELINNKTDIIEYYKIDQRVEVLFSVRSRKSNDRWFSSIVAYSIKPL